MFTTLRLSMKSMGELTNDSECVHDKIEETWKLFEGENLNTRKLKRTTLRLFKNFVQIEQVINTRRLKRFQRQLGRIKKTEDKFKDELFKQFSIK